MNNIFIHGFSVAGYRSFGPILQRLGPFGKINLFVGKNNSGKSNALRLILNYYQYFHKYVINNEKISLDHDLDLHKGMPPDSVSFGLAFLKDHVQSHAKVVNLKMSDTDFINLLDSKVWSEDSLLWVERGGTQNLAIYNSKPFVNLIHEQSMIDDRAWQKAWSDLTNKQSGNVLKHWIPESLDKLLVMPALPTRLLIPAFRRITKDPNVAPEHGGLGIIEELGKLQNPSHFQQDKKLRFDSINKFAQDVIGDDDLQLEIPRSEETINIHANGRTLPIESLGTGIYEVIILAAVATVAQNQIICIEEPEIHLHAILQKKLIKYLQDYTSNQYFIASHSGHIIDTPGLNIFHMRLIDGQSIVSHAVSPNEKHAIGFDLGYRASDLMQSNFILWVEGPSDRIYINHWIQSLDTDLVEGIHYSIMFYGGRLLNHLTPDDPDVSDFISLRRINRHLAILIDSDMKKASDKINATKRRIRDEFRDQSGFAWITKGREIENYIPSEILQKAVDDIYPDKNLQVEKGPYDKVLPKYTTNNSSSKDLDKIKIARKVTDGPANLDVLDLKTMIKKLITAIHDANTI